MPEIIRFTVLVSMKQSVIGLINKKQALSVNIQNKFLITGKI